MEPDPFQVAKYFFLSLVVCGAPLPIATLIGSYLPSTLAYLLYPIATFVTFGAIGIAGGARPAGDVTAADASAIRTGAVIALLWLLLWVVYQCAHVR
jgi:hypothetical protein